jgi:hypothetical protein
MGAPALPYLIDVLQSPPSEWASVAAMNILSGSLSTAVNEGPDGSRKLAPYVDSLLRILDEASRHSNSLVRGRAIYSAQALVGCLWALERDPEPALALLRKLVADDDERYSGVARDRLAICEQWLARKRTGDADSRPAYVPPKPVPSDLTDLRRHLEEERRKAETRRALPDEERSTRRTMPALIALAALVAVMAAVTLLLRRR